MTGAPAFRAEQARFTPITVAGVLAIIALSGVLAASVLQSGAGGQRLAPRIASGSARSQAAQAEPSVAATQAAVVPVPSSQPALSATSVPATGGSFAAVAGRGAVVAGAVAPAQASGSSQPPISIAATSGSAIRTTQGLRGAEPQSAPVAQFTPNVARFDAGAASASSSNALQAAQDQVLGIASTTTTAASSGIDPMTGVVPSTESSASSGSGSGVPVNTNPPFPSVQPYVGPVSTQAEAMQALGLPGDFQFGAEPDPYIVGSYQSFVTDAAAGDAAAQAGLNLAMSQGANFSGFE
jgi:hypothetical protein